MRWTLGNYTLKINPKALDRGQVPQNPVTVNANGTLSNPNQIFLGTQNFTIDVYEPPTKSTLSSITGSYIGISEKISNEDMYLLRNDGSFDVKTKVNTFVRTNTVVSGNGISLPSGNPICINDYDSGLAFIYPNSSGNILILTDENGIANRKYIYSTDDCRYIESIAWDYNSNFVALNPYGEIYSVNMSSGSETLIYQFSDYDTNKSSSKKRYSSIMMYSKNGKDYMGILVDSSNILFIDYNTYDIVCKSETGLSNVIGLSYSYSSGDCFSLLNSKVMGTSLNTCRIDIEQIKSAVSDSQVKVTDENGLPCLIGVRTLSITRDANSNEARYEVQIQGDLIYENVGFGNAWTKNNRS